VIHSDNHTVLFALPLPEDTTVPLIPRAGEDKWNKDFVKLPCSQSNKYSEFDEQGDKTVKHRWGLIKFMLTEFAINNSRDFEITVKRYNNVSAQRWHFEGLHELFEEEFSDDSSKFFFGEVLPKIIELALRLPELIKHPIPLLKSTKNHSVSLSQEQCGCLLANAFLCTFPQRNGDRKNTDYPEINFNRLFSIKTDQGLEKIKCILSYFKRICRDEMPTGVLTFQRRFVDLDLCPNWAKSDVKFSSMKLFVSAQGTIEDGIAMLQTDFANRYLGGGVLGWGCVQEEIRFMMNPEMIVGMLFCESMNSKEAILMTGCEEFNKYTGYSSSFKWAGGKTDTTPLDEYRRKMVYVTAIDAISFQKPHLQFEEALLKRELNKAFVGFYHDPNDELSPIPVSSGNWGCGAFRGFKPLKALIQLMACCVNRRNLAYFTFGEEELKDQIEGMFNWLCENEVTVGNLWKYLQEFRADKYTDRPQKLYTFIPKAHSRALEVKDALDNVTFSDDENSNDKRKADGSVSDEDMKKKTHPYKKVKLEDSTDESSRDSAMISMIKIENEDSEDTVEMKIDIDEYLRELNSDVAVGKDALEGELPGAVVDGTGAVVDGTGAMADGTGAMADGTGAIKVEGAAKDWLAAVVEVGPKSEGIRGAVKDDPAKEATEEEKLINLEEDQFKTETQEDQIKSEEKDDKDDGQSQSSSPSKTQEKSSQTNGENSSELQRHQPSFPLVSGSLAEIASKPNHEPTPSTSKTSPEIKKVQKLKITHFFKPSTSKS
jgi:hypothetical protein